MRARAFTSLLLLAATALPAARESLRQYADRAGFLIGTAVDPALFSEPAYARTLTAQFNMVEPENAMKWSAIRPARDTFNFAPGDAVVAFAELHGMKVRGHNLLWYAHNPAWLVRGGFTPLTLSELLREHILKVAGHYSGKVFAWDVVNEAFDADGTLRHSIWYDRPGIGLADERTAYIERAFRWAHAADPKALLFYNDYAAETVNPKSDAIYAMAKDFKSRGVPIDGIGLQMHISDLNEDLSSLAANIARITALGLEVQITEMDVALPVDPRGRPRDHSDLKRQAAIYRVALAACLANPGCTAFQTWGFTDKHSWLPRFSHGTKGAALLLDPRYRPKPAFENVAAALEQADVSPDRDRQTIVSLENEWLRATDAATLDRILAPDFVHPVSVGMFLTKQRHIRWFTAHPPPPNQHLRFDGLRVRLYGDTAIANGTVIESDAQGKQLNRTVFTDVFVRRNGRWQAVNGQENSVVAQPR